MILVDEVLSGGFYTFGEVDLIRCLDPDCAGGDESAIHIDSSATGTVDMAISVALNDLGQPVFATLPAITVVSCDDQDCAGSTDGTLDSEPSETIPVDGRPSSIRLDADGHPIVGFSAGGSAGIVRCNDAVCAGGDETIGTTLASPYGARDVYAGVDGLGRSVLAWVGGAAGDVLHLARCDDAMCTTPEITDVEWSGYVLDLLGMEIDPATNAVTVLYSSGWEESMKVFSLI